MVQRKIDRIYYENLELESKRQRVRLVRFLTIYGSAGEFIDFPIVEWEVCHQDDNQGDSDFFEALGYCWYIPKEDIITIFPIYRTERVDGYDITVTSWYMVIKEYPNFFLEGY